MEKKIIIKRAASLISALLFLIFGADLGPARFCLGDWILNRLGLSAWSKGTQGLHYPGIIALIGVAVSFCFFSITTKDPKKTTVWLIAGSIVLLYAVHYLFVFL